MTNVFRIFPADTYFCADDRIRIFSANSLIPSATTFIIHKDLSRFPSIISISKTNFFTSLKLSTSVHFNHHISCIPHTQHVSVIHVPDFRFILSSSHFQTLNNSFKLLMIAIIPMLYPNSSISRISQLLLEITDQFCPKLIVLDGLILSVSMAVPFLSSGNRHWIPSTIEIIPFEWISHQTHLRSISSKIGSKLREIQTQAFSGTDLTYVTFPS
jgi:hypothetical protein